MASGYISYNVNVAYFNREARGLDLAHESDEVMCKPSCDSSAKNTET
jgi:hypothetical protein